MSLVDSTICHMDGGSLGSLQDKHGDGSWQDKLPNQVHHPMDRHTTQDAGVDNAAANLESQANPAWAAAAAAAGAPTHCSKGQQQLRQHVPRLRLAGRLLPPEAAAAALTATQAAAGSSSSTQHPRLTGSAVLAATNSSTAMHGGMYQEYMPPVLAPFGKQAAEGSRAAAATPATSSATNPQNLRPDSHSSTALDPACPSGLQPGFAAQCAAFAAPAAGAEDTELEDALDWLLHSSRDALGAAAAPGTPNVLDCALDCCTDNPFAACRPGSQLGSAAPTACESLRSGCSCNPQASPGKGSGCTNGSSYSSAAIALDSSRILSKRSSSSSEPAVAAAQGGAEAGQTQQWQALAAQLCAPAGKDVFPSLFRTAAGSTVHGSIVCMPVLQTEGYSAQQPCSTPIAAVTAADIGGIGASGAGDGSPAAGIATAAAAAAGPGSSQQPPRDGSSSGSGAAAADASALGCMQQQFQQQQVHSSNQAAPAPWHAAAAAPGNHSLAGLTQSGSDACIGQPQASGHGQSMMVIGGSDEQQEGQQEPDSGAASIPCQHGAACGADNPAAAATSGGTGTAQPAGAAAAGAASGERDSFGRADMASGQQDMHILQQLLQRQPSLPPRQSLLREQQQQQQQPSQQQPSRQQQQQHAGSPFSAAQQQAAYSNQTAATIGSGSGGISSAWDTPVRQASGQQLAEPITWVLEPVCSAMAGGAAGAVGASGTLLFTGPLPVVSAGSAAVFASGPGPSQASSGRGPPQLLQSPFAGTLVPAPVSAGQQQQLILLSAGQLGSPVSPLQQQHQMQQQVLLQQQQQQAQAHAQQRHMQQLQLLQQLQHQQYQQQGSPGGPNALPVQSGTVRLSDLFSAEVCANAHQALLQRLDAAYAAGFSDGVEAAKHGHRGQQGSACGGSRPFSAPGGGAQHQHQHQQQQQQQHRQRAKQQQQQQQQQRRQQQQQAAAASQPLSGHKRPLSGQGEESAHADRRQQQLSPVAQAAAAARQAAESTTPAAALAGGRPAATAAMPPVSAGTASRLPPLPPAASAAAAAAAVAKPGSISSIDDLLAPSNIAAIDTDAAAAALRQLSDAEILLLAARAVTSRPIGGSSSSARVGVHSMLPMPAPGSGFSALQPRACMQQQQQLDSSGQLGMGQAGQMSLGLGAGGSSSAAQLYMAAPSLPGSSAAQPAVSAVPATAAAGAVGAAVSAAVAVQQPPSSTALAAVQVSTAAPAAAAAGVLGHNTSCGSLMWGQGSDVGDDYILPNLTELLDNVEDGEDTEMPNTA